MTTTTETTIAPEVHMGAYRPVGSDRYAYTIVHVSKSGREISVRPCRALRIDSNEAQSESQEHVFAEDETAEIERYTLRRSGRWVLKGKPDKPRQGTRLYIGKRCSHRDPHF